MKNNNYKKNPISDFFILALWMSIFIYLQSYILPILPRPFCFIDFATIALIYFSFENELLTSFFLAVLSGALLDSLSAIKPGFFITYFLISLLILQVLSKFLSFDNLLNKFIAFLGLFILKFLFFYFMIDTNIVSMFNFISKFYIEFIISSFVFLIFVKALSLFNSYFQKYKYSYNPHFKNWR